MGSTVRRRPQAGPWRTAAMGGGVLGRGSTRVEAPVPAQGLIQQAGE